jgi:hypothetical protein
MTSFWDSLCYGVGMLANMSDDEETVQETVETSGEEVSTDTKEENASE